MTDYKALYEAEVKRREKAETRWNKVMKVSRDSKERIKELEKQIEKLEGHANAFSDLVMENERLKEYETMIHCVWSDLYWADKAGCEVSFKDVSASCEYYENEDFVKAEVVDDDSD
jgi:hypothetical protein